MERSRITQTNDASQILRWGTPGWLFILALLSFAILDAFFNLSLGANSEVLPVVVGIARESISTAILVAGAGVPIGYMFYQLYFWLRWNWPFAAKGILWFRGRNRDIAETIAGVAIEELAKKEKWRKDYLEALQAFSDGQVIDHRKAWYFLEVLFLEAASKGEAARLMYERSRYLLDILHALGTGLVAIVLGWIAYVVSELLLIHTGTTQFQIQHIIAIICNLVVLVVLWIIFQANRENTRAQIISLQNFLIRRLAAAPKGSSD